MSRVAIVGMGLHPFGKFPEKSALDMGVEATRLALKDAGLDWRDINIGFGGSRDGGYAMAAVNELGLTGLPFVNLYTGCATGGSSLFAAANAVRAGTAKYALALGFDKHERGAFSPNARNNGVPSWFSETGLMVTTQFFALKIQRYMHEHGISKQTLAQVAEKAFYNGSLNSNAWRRDPVSADYIAQSTMVSDPLTKFMFCSPSQGGAAIILTSEEEAKRMGAKPVFLDAMEMRTRQYGSFEVYETSLAKNLGPAVTTDAAKAAFEAASIGPDEIDVLQLQDTETGAEIMHMAENGFCDHGEQEKLIRDGATAIGGSMPVNTDGGCLANGEPIGASGLRQVYEICLQLRGAAGKRQVPNSPKTGYTHVYGAPGISAVNILSI
ncbi:thiolase family protein [Litorimonas haliclonae]|uniref:thiolase family protein n=1 Tax=Litorimonas haliclonae TaxID=2081977 RepID=UPI0039F05917